VFFFDIVSQFYTVHSEAVRQALERYAPRLLYHLPLLLRQSVLSFFGGTIVRPCEALNVGDPMASLMANLTTLGPLTKLQERLGRCNADYDAKLFADNYAICADVSRVEEMYLYADAGLRSTGMSLARRDSNVVVVRVQQGQEKPFEDIRHALGPQWTVRAMQPGGQRVPQLSVQESGATILGVPIGATAFQQAEMARKAGAIVELVSKLHGLPLQVALDLYKRNVAPMTGYLARNLAPTITKGPLSRITEAFYQLLEEGLGTPLSPLVRRQLITPGAGPYAVWDGTTFCCAAYLAGQAAAMAITGTHAPISNDTILAYNRQVEEQGSMLPVDADVAIQLLARERKTQRDLSAPIRKAAVAWIKTEAFKDPFTAWRYEANKHTGSAPWINPAARRFDPLGRSGSTSGLALSEDEFRIGLQGVLLQRGQGLTLDPGFSPTCASVVRSTGEECSHPMDHDLFHATMDCVVKRYEKHQLLLYSVLGICRQLGCATTTIGRLRNEDTRRGDGTVSYYDVKTKAQTLALIDVANIGINNAQLRGTLPNDLSIDNRVSVVEKEKIFHYEEVVGAVGAKFVPIVTTTHAGFGGRTNQFIKDLAQAAAPGSTLTPDAIARGVRQRLQLGIISGGARRYADAYTAAKRQHNVFLGGRVAPLARQRLVASEEEEGGDGMWRDDEFLHFDFVPPASQGVAPVAPAQQPQPPLASTPGSNSARAKRTYKCGHCKQLSHNRRACPLRRQQQQQGDAGRHD
jgi:hypothetical protein